MAFDLLLLPPKQKKTRYFHAHHLLDVTVGAAMGGLVTHYVPELYGVRPTEFNWTHVAATQAGLISSMLLLRPWRCGVGRYAALRAAVAA